MENAIKLTTYCSVVRKLQISYLGQLTCYTNVTSRPRIKKMKLTMGHHEIWMIKLTLYAP